MIQVLGKALGRLLLACAVLIVAVWLFAPGEPMQLDRRAPALAADTDLDAHFAQAEAALPDIRDGLQKRVVWAGAAGTVTPISVVYIHGFSASSQEVSPVPERVAQGLGANLVLTRLAGHGRTGAAMAEATAEDWMADVDEALNAARLAGKEVLVMATSTGGTLSAMAALDPARMERVKAMVFVSPNFGLNAPGAWLLTLPGVRYWGPLVFGRTRGWEPATPEQAHAWTSSYPSVAILPMTALVKHVMAQDLSAAKVPLLIFQSRADQVVTPAKTEEVARRWGGPVTLDWVVLGPDDDPSAHGITGDLLSPSQTSPFVARILAWLGELG